MAHPLWSDAGTWIALGVSAVAVTVGVALSVAFRRVLRQQSPPADPPASPLGAAARPRPALLADPERHTTP